MFGNITQKKTKFLDNTYQISYTAPPSIDKVLCGQVVTEGQDVKFEAIVDGIPFPDISWSRDGVSLESNDKVMIEKEEGSISCMIKNVSRKDFGLYHLRCSNDSGTAESEAVLTVNGKYYFGSQGEHWEVLGVNEIIHVYMYTTVPKA